MLKIIKLHADLIKVLRIESKKKKSLKQLIYFLRDVLKSYFKYLLRMYAEIFLQFNPKYQEQKKQFEKHKQYKKDIANAWKIIQWMLKQGEKRIERKQIRRDFLCYGKISKELERELMKDIYGVKG